MRDDITKKQKAIIDVVLMVIVFAFLGSLLTGCSHDARVRRAGEGLSRWGQEQNYMRRQAEANYNYQQQQHVFTPQGGYHGYHNY